MLSIAIADSHPLYRMGLLEVLRGNDHSVVASSDSVAGAIESTSRLRPDILIVSKNLDQDRGFAVIRAIQRDGYKGKLLLLVDAATPEDLADARRLKIDCVFDKESGAKALRECLETISGGGQCSNATASGSIETSSRFATLTKRERRVALLIREGLKNDAIADQLA